MKHFSRIEITNFESHLDTAIDLHPGVNVVTGTNGVGKSGLLRAIMFVVYNHPTAGFDGMVRWGKTSATVKIDTFDGCWVLREKGKSINKYVVYDPSQSPEPVTYEGFGIDPPEAVGVALGIKPISMGKSDKIFLHFSQQDEPTFMLSRSAPEIARWMYSLTNLEDIQAAIDSLNLDYKAKNDSIKEADRRIERLAGELAEFSDVEKMELALQSVMEELRSLQQEEEDIDDLQKILNDLMSIKKKAVPLKDRIANLERVVEGDLQEDIQSMLSSVEDLISLTEIMELIESSVKEVAKARAAESLLLKLDKIDFAPLTEEVDALLELVQLQQEISDVNSRVSKAQLHIADLEQAILENEKIMEEKNKRIKEFMGKRCPTCGGEIGEDALKHIMEES